jgi:non-lysosomal glucosylceramidase
MPIPVAGRSYPGEAAAAAFLLGGIGTGNVSIGSRGELRDWEIFNRPGKGNVLPYSFFAMRVQADGRGAITRILEGRLQPPFTRSHGFYPGDVAGLPRLRRSTMSAEYPFVTVEFEDLDLPVAVALEAFTPFVPLDADASGLPAAVLRYRVRNTASVPVDVSVVGSLANAVGLDGHGLFFSPTFVGAPRNRYRTDGPAGLFFDNPGLAPDDLRHGSMALTSTAEVSSVKPSWLEGSWADGIQDFWTDFATDGRLESDPVPSPGGGALAEAVHLKVGSLAIERRLEPGAEQVFEYLLTWHFPNRIRGWGGHIMNLDTNADQIERNHYATRFDDARDVAIYLARELEHLEGQSRSFQQAFFATSMPRYVLDAVAANITVLRSPTCFRIEDGTLLAWEGGFDQRGSCEGSCTHVWNYAQTMAFLFPDLERSMRRVEFLLETDPDGRMAFRTNRVFGGPGWDMIPAADGQLGTIVRLYRDWQISGDDAFLRDLWPGARRALEYGLRNWDLDGDLVLDAEQHTTYDIELYGTNPMTNSIWLAALVAAARIAQHLGADADARRYRDALAVASERIDTRLWNGEYYVQKIDDIDTHPYQFGDGCLSDQVLGQLLAHVSGLGYVLPRSHVRTAVEAIFRHNFRSSFADHENVQRTFVLNDEQGLVLCSWPRGGRPRFPFIYSDEVWTGVEYQVAAHLIFEGLVDEGLTIVRAVRDRHDGVRRNPWNEVECGNHYVRSMASWAVYLALSGMHVDLVAGSLSFEPARDAGSFTGFWVTGRGWGTYQQRANPETGGFDVSVEVLYGTIDGVTVSSRSTPGAGSAHA